VLYSKTYGKRLRLNIDAFIKQHFKGIARTAADYKLVHHCKNGRSVYSFCMCPGGTVVAATSEAGHIVTNGMSQYSRNERRLNIDAFIKQHFKGIARTMPDSTNDMLTADALPIR
jgi:uncharacterized FAD-dependent dehydrogenase